MGLKERRDERDRHDDKKQWVQEIKGGAGVCVGLRWSGEC